MVQKYDEQLILQKSINENLMSESNKNISNTFNGDNSAQKIRTSKEKKIKPLLNKLFMNRIRGWIEEQYAFKNLDTTKKQLLQKYGVPQDCKLYNYKQAESRMISKQDLEYIPVQVQQQINSINRTMGIGVAGLMFIGASFYGGGLYFKQYTKWGRLTSSGWFQKALMYCTLLNSTNYFVLVRNSEELEIMFKYHKIYQEMIRKYEQRE